MRQAHHQNYFYTSHLMVLCSIVLDLSLNPPPVEVETSNEK